jgi:hypothetical protein
MVAFLDTRPVRGFLGFPKAASAVREVIFNDLSIRECRPPRLVSYWLRDAHGHLMCHWDEQPGDDVSLGGARTRCRQRIPGAARLERV